MTNLIEGNMKVTIFAILVVLSLSTARAEYIATGEFKGTVCHGIGIEWCSPHKLAAVKGDDGKLYELNTRYDSVTEHNGNSCIISTKSTAGGILSFAINMINQPVFYEKDSSGKLNELDVDYITFQCVERQSY